MHDFNKKGPHHHDHSHEHASHSQQHHHPASGRGSVQRVVAGLKSAVRGAAGRLRKNWEWSAVVVGCLYILSGIYFVPADQQAVRLQFGRLLPGVIQPGLHYCWPYPFEQVIRLKMNEARRLSIGADDFSRTLAVSQQVQEYLLSVEIRIWCAFRPGCKYYIEHPADYLFQTRDLPQVLEAVFLRSMTRAVAGRKVDDILTTGRIVLQSEVLGAVQQECKRLGLGVALTTVALEGAVPPEEVRSAFLEVANAREDRNRIVQEAEGYTNELVPLVRGQVQEMIERAEIYRTELINRSMGEASGFLKVWQQYREHPQVTTARLILETVDEVLPRIRKVSLDDQGNRHGLDVDIFELQKK
ncbi:MAG: FtsH protease activity modulator HflK [Acidobacteriota bacterium]